MTDKPTASTTTETTEPITMRAMVADRYGTAAEVLGPRDVPVPEVEADEVLVKVRYSSVNAKDWHLLTGKPYVFRAMGLDFTPILGADVSGVVVAIGQDVSRFQVGDEVFGLMESGAYAEYAKTKDRHLAAVPPGVSLQDAAAVPLAGLTALQGLRDFAGVGPGSKVVINGASGGVGTYAIQIATVLGATVTAVCSTRNVELARSLGAERVIDYTQEDFTTDVERFDAMFDLPGNRPLGDCQRVLAPGGVYVMVGGSKGKWTGPLLRLMKAKLLFGLGDKRGTNFLAESRSEDLEYLGELLASGDLRSAIVEVCLLEDVGPALDRQGEFHARGKTVVVVDGSL